MNMMMIGHVGWFILALLYCSYFETSITSQNEVKDGKINTCETSMSLALPCRSKLPSSVSELTINVVTCTAHAVLLVTSSAKRTP